MSNEDKNAENNVLTLDREKADTRIAAIDKIERYWHEIRGARLVPSRCEVDPKGLDGVLGHAFILERITAGLARFRIAGSHMTELTGLELRQMPVSALFMPNSREILADALGAAFDEPATVRARLESRGGFGRSRLEGEMVLLPLRSDLGDIDRVLGGIALNGQIGRTPRRLEILSQSRQSLVGFAGPRHGTDRPSIATKGQTPQVSDAPTSTARANAARSGLRLVVDNS